MSVILLDITQNSDGANTPFVVESVNSAADGTWTDTNDGDPPHLELHYISDSSSLWTDTGSPFPSPFLFAGNDSGECVEIRNSSGSTVTEVDLYSGGKRDSFPNLGNNQSIYFVVNGQQSRFQQDPCCVAKGTRVRTTDGSYKRIENLTLDDSLLDFQNQPVSLTRIVKFDIPTREFIQLDKLKICRDHPILDADGLERPCQEAEGAEAVQLDTATPVYTLVTAQKTYVEMDEQQVGTWSERAWQTNERILPSHQEVNPKE